MKLFFKNEVIEFYCLDHLEGSLPEPYPASKKIPEWWINLDMTFPERDLFGSDSFTAKKCSPLLDAMTLGYIIPLQGDLQVISNNDNSIIDVINPPNRKLADFHDPRQVGGKNGVTNGSRPIKFLNYWIIKTAPGWSTLFLPPINSFGSPFTCITGLVDTDKYITEINFPAIWNTANFDGKLPAGTPLVTAIPIKRKSFPTRPKVRKITKKEAKEKKRIIDCLESRSSYYANDLREKK